LLSADEDDAVIDARTGEVVLNHWMLPDLEGCHVEKGAQLRESPVRFARIPVPAEAIVESCG
jgi:hypothetical protein